MSRLQLFRAYNIMYLLARASRSRFGRCGMDEVTHTLFVIYEDAKAVVSETDLASAFRATGPLPGLAQGLAFTPILVEGDQPFARDGRGPPLVIQLDFDNAGSLDASASGGPLLDIMRPGALASLASAKVTHQRMLGRRFSVADPEFKTAPGAYPLTFLVEYSGTTADLEAWLDHYDAHHPPIMSRFPGIRDVATFRPAPTRSDALPGRAATAMQRNKVVFDSGEALIAALASPVMAEMAADAATFPPYSGKATHFPMATHFIA
jgi:uncharacterized protein (TIGR02118 family)